MTTNVNQPIEVDTPEPITILKSATNALTHDSSKSIHLSPHQAKALLTELESLWDEVEKYIKLLTSTWKGKQALALLAEDERKEKVIMELADKLSAFEAREYQADAHDRPNPQPFYMVAEND